MTPARTVAYGLLAGVELWLILFVAYLTWAVR